MQSLIHHGGKTLLIVGHNVHQIERICSRMILLDHGAVLEDGVPGVVTNKYFELNAKAEMARLSLELKKHWSFESSGDLEVTSLETCDVDTAEEKESFYVGEPVLVRLHITSRKPFDGVDMGVAFHTTDLVNVAISPLTASLPAPTNIPLGRSVVECLFTEMRLLPGVFQFKIGIKDCWGHMLWHGENIGKVHIVPSGDMNHSRLSSITFVQFDARWSVSEQIDDSVRCVDGVI